MVPWMQPERILSCVMDRLAQERARQGLSLTQLAALAGVSMSSIGMMEQGQRSSRLVTCLRVADALGLQLEDLLSSVKFTHTPRGVRFTGFCADTSPCTYLCRTPGAPCKRRAPGKVAGQRCGERFSAGEDRACSGRVPRLLAPPVPCRAADTFRKPRLLCGPSWADAVRPAPPLRAQAGFLASFRVRHFAVLRGWSCLRLYYHMRSASPLVPELEIQGS
jgi:DNA-binding XRE family transcriptional regulator